MTHKKTRSARKKSRNLLAVIILRAAQVSALSAAVYLFWLPDVSLLKTHPPKETAMMRIREREMKEKGRKNRRLMQWMPYENISPYLRQAVVIAEDDTFYRHQGIEPMQIKRALLKDLERKQLAYGGSTITQQLAKNLYLSPSKNPLRKVKEMLIAWKLEKALSKKRILEIYLNVVEWGPGIYGAEAASRVYFGKSAAELTLDEAVSLAVTLPNPRRYNPLKESRYVALRKEDVLKRMRKAGYLPSEEDEAAEEVSGAAPSTGTVQPL